VNLYDDGETFTIEALAPGVDPARLDVTVGGNTLTLAGEKAGPAGVPPERIHRSERAAGRFVRTVEVPTEVDAAGVRAVPERAAARDDPPRRERPAPAGGGAGELTERRDGGAGGAGGAPHG
jgi:HSP20 family protein